MELDTPMHHLRVEELTRNKGNKHESTEKAHVVENKLKSRFSPKKKDFKKTDKGRKKPYDKYCEETRTRIHCYVCGKISHLARASC